MVVNRMSLENFCYEKGKKQMGHKIDNKIYLD